MNYLKKSIILLIAVVSVTGLSITVTPPKTKLTPEQIKLAELQDSIRVKYDKALVKHKLGQWDELITNGIQGKAISALRYKSFAKTAKKWSEYKYIELDTGYSKRWFTGLYMLLDYMGKCKRRLTLMKMHKKDNTAEYQEVKDKFIQAYGKFKELKKSPFNASSRNIKILRRQRRKTQYYLDTAMRKYKKT